MSAELGEARLGQQGLTTSRIGLGTAPLATVFWGNDEPTAVATVERAFSAGIRLFDTAPFYGLGECERRLGAGLAGHRDDVTIATKVGRALTLDAGGQRAARFEFGYDAALASIEASLQRIGTDRVDIVHVHDPDDHVDDALAGAHAALCRLRDEGTIRAVSVGTNSVATASAFLDRGDLDAMLVAGRFTLLDQTADDLIDRCAAAGVSFIAAGVFNSGVLARPVAGSWFDYAAAEPSVLARAAAIAKVGGQYGHVLREAAVRFVLDDARISAVVLGMAAPGEVDENMAAAADGFDDLWVELASAGLIATTPTRRPRP